MFIEVFVKVVPNRNQIKLQLDGIQASSDSPLVPSVIFQYAKCTLSLDRAIHAEKGAVDAFEVAQYFFVDSREFLVQADRSVLFSLLTLFSIRATAAVLTLKDLVLPSVEITFDRRSVSKLEFPVVRTEQAAIRVGLEVYRTEWIVAVVLVFRFFLIHGELHEFLHPM